MLNVHVPSFLFTHPCTLNCNDSVVPRITMRNDGRTASLSHSSSFGDTCSTLVFTPGTDRDDRTWRILRACQLRPSPIRSAASLRSLSRPGEQARDHCRRVALFKSSLSCCSGARKKVGQLYMPCLATRRKGLQWAESRGSALR